jgi:dTMP kinase
VLSAENGPDGRFVVFEGGEGSGKSTVAAEMGRRLRAAGLDVVLVREPGSTPAGEAVRRLLHERLAPWAEAFAFLLARAQLVEDVIRPALGRGALVLCDRFAASTFAYQGFGRGLELATLRAANTAATGGLEPDLTLWLDVDPATGFARKRGESEAITTGAEDLAFHARVRAGYRALMAEARPGSWVRIEANEREATVVEAAWEALRPLAGKQ